jgi:hypothetical protein
MVLKKIELQEEFKRELCKGDPNMKKNDSLFTLIKSLTKNEKGYLKKHAHFNGINYELNNYIKIFDAIDAQVVYNEARLLKKFKDERFIKQFAVAKNYLYDIILEILESYNKTSELRSLLNKAEILVGKGLFKGAKKMLRKTKKHAVDEEAFGYILEIKLLEQSVDRLQHNKESLKNSVNVWDDEIKSIIIKMENLEKYEQLKDQLYLQYIEKGSSYTAAETRSFGWMMEKPFLKNKDQALSFRAKILFNEIHAMYFEYTGDFEKSYTHSLAIHQEIQKNPLALKIVANSHVSFLYYHSMRCVNNGMQAKALETLLFLERVPCKTEIEKTNLSFMVIRVKLKMYFKMKLLKECLTLIPEMEQLLNKGAKVDNLLKEEIYQQLIALLIISKQYDAALNWFIKKNTEVRSLYNHALNYTERMLEIICQYELNNFNIVNNRLKSAHRFLLSQNKLNSWENTLLSFFYYLLNEPKKETPAISNIVFLESETIHSLENNSLSHFVILSWLKSAVLYLLESKRNNKKKDERKQVDYSIADE